MNILKVNVFAPLLGLMFLYGSLLEADVNQVGAPRNDSQQVNVKPNTSVTSGKSLCPCECGCAAPCNCGCVESGGCHCNPKLTQCPCECGCAAPCSCGCAESTACHCNPKLSQSDVQAQQIAKEASTVAFYTDEKYTCACGCGCESSCSCSCAEGAACNCAEVGCSEGYCGQEADDLTVVDPYEEGHSIGNSGIKGIWLPDDAPLFRPFLADPRQITSSVGWRFNDNLFDKSVIDVSYYDNTPFYRWENVWIQGSQLEVGLEGALWAIFSPLKFSSPLLNADYYIGFPVTYAFDDWSFRFRAYHISCHIGDEFLLDHPGFDRRNPSAEFVDFFVSHHIVEDIRLYGGLGWIVAQDDSFPCARVYAEGGVEVRLHGLMFTDRGDRLYGLPFYAVNFRHNTDFDHHFDSTYVVGYEVGKTCGLWKCLRVYLEYHDGYSFEGQFGRMATNYLSLRLSYGF